MKVLVGYDGSTCSDSAIVDLKRAGLPERGEAIVLTVAETTPLSVAIPFGALAAGPGILVPEFVESETSSEHHLKEALEYADHGADRLRADFPTWHITTEAWVDAPAAAVIRKARAWSPDLVVVGSHGRSGFMRMLLGSVSHSVLHHVTCPVRISRHRLHSQDRAIRIVVGVDGSACAKAAVDAVAAWDWPAGTEARVIGVLDSRIKIAAATTLEGTIPASIEEECRSCMENAVRNASNRLAAAGLHATHEVHTGKPEEVLVDQAEIWGADSIFVGARGLHMLERVLLGSVSTTVASRAHCSVEVVRACS